MSGPRTPTARACLTLRSSQLEALRGLSLATGAPVAELARRAVDAYLAGRVAGYVSSSRDSGPVPYGTGSAPSAANS